MKTVFTYAYVKWFLWPIRARVLFQLFYKLLSKTHLFTNEIPYITLPSNSSGFTLWLYTLVEYYYPSDVRALTTPLVLDVFYLASQGVPTHDHTGEPLSGKLSKKLKKMYQQQEKLYNSVGAGQAANGSTEN